MAKVKQKKPKALDIDKSVFGPNHVCRSSPSGSHRYKYIGDTDGMEVYRCKFCMKEVTVQDFNSN